MSDGNVLFQTGIVHASCTFSVSLNTHLLILGVIMANLKNLALLEF